MKRKAKTIRRWALCSLDGDPIHQMKPIKLYRFTDRHGEVKYHTASDWVKFAQTVGSIIADEAEGYFITAEELERQLKETFYAGRRSEYFIYEWKWETYADYKREKEGETKD